MYVKVVFGGGGEVEDYDFCVFSRCFCGFELGIVVGLFFDQEVVFVGVCVGLVQCCGGCCCCGCFEVLWWLGWFKRFDFGWFGEELYGGLMGKVELKVWYVVFVM